MAFVSDVLLRTRWIPWRLRNRAELWLERRARTMMPGLYRLAYLGRWRDLVARVTEGPRHHFFGYYDKSPWSGNGDLLLAHEAGFNDRPPGPHDVAAVGVIRWKEGHRFEALGQTRAWNWQQGSMLQWHPAAPDELVLHNDRSDGGFVGVVRDLRGRVVREYERPFYAVSPDGRFALGLNFSRLHRHRPGYGYAGVPDPWADVKAPGEDGVFRTDLATGAVELVVPLARLADTRPVDSMADAFHWVNHVQISPGATRFAFLHRWAADSGGFETRLYVARPDGSGLSCLLDGGMVSHYDWMDEDRLLAWARVPGVGDRFVLCDCRDGSLTVVGEGVLTQDGHCSYSPDREWILNDTYPDGFEMRTLMLFRCRDGKRLDLARLLSPKSIWGEIRCDLHPRWSRDGRFVCFDSIHEGQRQMYVVDVSRWTAGG